MAAATLELGLARREIELVMHDQDFLGRDLEEPRQRTDGLAREIHESLGL